MKKVRLVMWGLLVLLVAQATAGVYVINPVLNIAYRSDGAVDSYCYYAFYPLQYKYWRTASKFQIPTLAPNEQVVSLVLEFNITEKLGYNFWIHNGYETNDSWGTYTAYTLGSLDSPYVSTAIDGTGVYTADVTSFLSQPGEGPGQLLTILGDFGSGYNASGASGTYRRLILTTEIVPEPATIAILGLGAFLALNRKKA